MTIKEAAESNHSSKYLDMDVTITQELFNLGILEHDYWGDDKIYPKNVSKKEASIRDCIWEYVLYQNLQDL